MTLRFAFIGFRHGHIFGLYDLARQRPDIEIAACCEEDSETRLHLQKEGRVDLTHQDYAAMLKEVDCDVLAVGDYYGKRGRILIDGLEAGKHVIGDKPLCTRLSELDEIESLSATKALRVGCMLDMPDSGQCRSMRRLIQAGQIGQVHAISFDGQHPLNYGTRPGWYFEQNKHGGTLNDIAIHALDFIPWSTGLNFTVVNAARNWNAALKQVPFFNDAAQVMLTMDNGCGVLGDVSYLTPDSMGYTMPNYWRMTVWGQDGVLETSATMDGLMLYQNGQKRPQRLKADQSRLGGYLEDFLSDICGEAADDGLTTSRVLRSSRIALGVQEAADRCLTNVEL